VSPSEATQATHATATAADPTEELAPVGAPAKPELPPAPPRPPKPARVHSPVSPSIRVAAEAITLLGALILGFFAYFYGLSGTTEARAQTTLYRTMAGQLALAVAPVGPTTENAPVAILDIPALGIYRMVVVEGTTSGDLMNGPGHLRSSVLPGQAGQSVVFGREAGFGGPFAHLMRLNRGDKITAVTGQGVATYVVESFGTSVKPPPDPTPNRLILETADSSLLSRTTVEVSADLVSDPQPSPGGLPSTGSQENALAGDPGALVALLLWAQALLIVSVVGTIAAYRWSRPAAYLCAAPAGLALVWLIYQNFAALLPNLY
jgi:sortase A